MRLVVGHVARSRRELRVALDDFVHGLEEILLGGDLASGSDGKHSSFSADGSDLSASGVGAQTRQQFESDVAFDGHRPSVDLENVSATLQVRQAELHFSVETSRTHEGGVEGVGTVRGHEDFDVAARVEAVELVDELQHGSLDLVVATSSVVETSATWRGKVLGSKNSRKSKSLTNRVDFVEENQTSLLAARHFEKLADHSCAFTDVFLDQLGSDDTDEASVSTVGYSSSTQGLSSSRLF